VRSASRFYRVNLAVGAAAALALVLALASAWRVVNLGVPSPHDLLQACRHVVFSGETVISLTVLVLVGTCLAVLVLAIRSGLRHYRAQRVALSKLPVQYEARYRGVGLTVFTHEHPEAFSAGLLKPRLFLSRGALHNVATAELAAVIEHEVHHCRRRDPLRLLIVQLISDALFFVPAMQRLSQRYRTLAELAADDAAVSKGSCPGTLAAALLAFTEGTRPGVVGIAPERVDHLLGERAHWNLPVALLACTLVTLLVLMATAMVLVYTVAPGDLSFSTMSAQVCMVVMAWVPGACSNPMDMVPFTVGVCLVAVAYRRHRRAVRHG
jgi:Zn-dependent protease with chaperone function